MSLVLPIVTDPRLVAGVLALAVVAWALSTRQRIRRNRQRWMVFQRARDAIALPHTASTLTTTAKENGAPSVSAPETPYPLGLRSEQ